MCEQRYPSWRSVLPQQSPYTATVEARALLSALRRVNPFSSEGSNMVKLSFDAGRLTVTAEDYDFSRAASENVAIQDTNLPDGFAIGLKNSSFMAMLQVAAKTENVVLSLADASRAILIKPEDHNDATTALVMPMLLSA
jgi:DNA polymerase-3 subunit beta